MMRSSTAESVRRLRPLAIALCLVALVSCQCGKRDFDENLNLRLPPVPNGETCLYRVLMGPDSVGTFETVVVQDWFGETAAYVLINVMRIAGEDARMTDSSLVVVARNRLVPLSSFRFIRTGDALRTTGVNYGQEVAVAAYNNSPAPGEDSVKRQLLPNDKLTYDTDQLIFLGRALRLDPKRPVQVKVVNPMGPPLGGEVQPAEFRTGGDEIQAVPAGRFDCRKVLLKVGDSEVTLWYEKAGTGRLIRYQAPETGVVLELLPPAPGEPTMDRPVQPGPGTE
jgi:hypothetical protein